MIKKLNQISQRGKDMTNEYGEELYNKFSKDISKKERNGLKRSLQACDNSKYQALKNLVLQKKNP